MLFYCSSIAAYMLLNAKGEVGVASALYAGGATVLVVVTGIIFLMKLFLYLKFQEFLLL
ncbi:hypothetical protein AAAC51_40060 [Priestia megaterium]